MQLLNIRRFTALYSASLRLYTFFSTFQKNKSINTNQTEPNLTQLTPFF